MDLQRELEQLQRRLEEKEAMITAQKEIISKQEEQIKKQQIQIENMVQALLHARKKIFGASSEKTQIEGQMHLFMTEQELAVELLK
ncbi:MAG: IS66 family transposase, partial [Lachnospiraceae bacterium]|nr:IS66 family transposase [Lachnospiraceae bacterium]